MNYRSELETHIQCLLGKINHRQCALANKQLAPLMMTRSQVTVLMQFLQAPGKILTTTQLVDVMNMNQPGVTKIVKQLLDQGYLEIVRVRKDKRLKELKITDAGLEKCASAQSLLDPVFSSVFLHWDASELKELSLYLERISHALNDPGSTAASM